MIGGSLLHCFVYKENGVYHDIINVYIYIFSVNLSLSLHKYTKLHNMPQSDTLSIYSLHHYLYLYMLIDSQPASRSSDTGCGSRG